MQESTGQNQREGLKEGSGFSDLLKKRWVALKEWVKPNPADAWYITALKSVYKMVALLLLVAFSPVILLVLAMVFFAAF